MLIAVASTPVELPANTVAIVSEVPRRAGTITKVEFHYALAQAAAQAGRKSTPKPGGNGYGKLKEMTIGELLDLLSAAIQLRVVRGIRGESAAQKAFNEFVDAYEERWRARTVCAPEYTIARCSNAVPATQG